MAKHYKKKKKQVTTFLLTIFIITFIISSAKIIEWYINNEKNENIRQEISEVVTIERTEKNEEEYNIDFEKLKEKNTDSIGWLKVNGTNIDYPVVQATENNYYLKHNFNKEYNSAGWVFADYRNKLDGTDKNIIIYGHNMKDNSMFGSLRNVLKKEWYNDEKNYIINFITENENQKYEIFSIYQIEAEDYYIKTNFEGEEFTKYIQTITSRSIKDFNIKVTEEDKILTLSTCADNNKYRIVVHAKKAILY